ncbi:MAG: hypothetical protein HYV95_04855 [Opitutae bacterium]|nr:hypothetical protein [Opitutae bacterium]
MSRRLLTALAALFAATLVAGAPATPAKAPAKSAVAGFERTKARITELLGPRQKAVPLPAVLPNPFSVTAAPAPDPGSNTPAGPPAAPVDLLTRLAQSFRIGGVIQRGDKPSLIINSAAYREGDILPIREGETVHRVRIKQITSTHVTFELDGDETTLPLR